MYRIWNLQLQRKFKTAFNFLEDVVYKLIALKYCKILTIIWKSTITIQSCLVLKFNFNYIQHLHLRKNSKIWSVALTLSFILSIGLFSWKCLNLLIVYIWLPLFFTSHLLCSLRLLKLKTEGQNIQTENLTEKLLTNPGLA